MLNGFGVVVCLTRDTGALALDGGTEAGVVGISLSTGARARVTNVSWAGWSGNCSLGSTSTGITGVNSELSMGKMFSIFIVVGTDGISNLVVVVVCSWVVVVVGAFVVVENGCTLLLDFATFPGLVLNRLRDL